jgi:PPOX class probable F420-dependent enzyme
VTDELTPAMRGFLDERRLGVLATVNRDGSPHQTVMWYLLDADEVLFNTARGRIKDRNLRRDQRASLMVHDGYRYLRLQGRVRAIEERATAQADIRRLAVRYEGEASADRQVREGFSKQERISYRFRVERVYSGGF